MALFIDTSALYSALSSRDEHHQAARSVWAELLSGDEPLITDNYILVETNALLGRRVGFQAVRDFQTDFVPILQVFWVDEALHERAMTALLTAGTRDLSLVDCVSFELMRGLGIARVFAFDAHFVQQGFRCIP